MLKQFLSTSLVSFISVPLVLLTNVLLARWMSVEHFGTYSLVLSIAMLLTIPVSSGLPLLLTREVSMSTQAGDEGLYWKVTTTAVAWVVFSSLVLIIVAAAIKSAMDNEIASHAFLASLIVPAFGIIAICEGGLKGMGRPAISELISRSLPPLAMVVGAFLFFRNGTSDALIVVFLTLGVHFGVALGAIIVVVNLSPGQFFWVRPNSDDVVGWGVSFVTFAFVSGLATLGAHMATILLGLVDEPEQVAFLRVAERGSQLVAFPLLYINAVLGPHIVRSLRQGKPSELQQLSKRAARMTTVVSAPLVLVLIIFGKALIGVTFGEEYVEGSYLLLVILCCTHLVSVMLGSAGYFLMMTGHEKLNLLAQSAGAALLLLALLVLVPAYGAIGGAIGVTIGIMASKVFAVICVRKKLGFVTGII